ncbi:Ubiquitin-conjugating enzyme E2 R2 [Trichoplax sp. H2]|uniref:UBC core domain-containing protein n=1 Tax=Trichoplax adhaerens TaxID=10228 RepID=B3S7Z5_TRIAD|nr:hypothetical protein TRIADDRAFT_50867 [Trichoplax adhaerens]EDV21020.1 hypothetical protein TRIADDRAFT_50867 [Trichoplax adhaerens]RDD37760.1 Ubiquitin-conjugating enzyme E2 R2 [Trichoplax sp. H2]|eukprot:XP_002116350.1 hypothetical protein TRIADDRAFT_50867 [Trichoplax adhaerens]
MSNQTTPALRALAQELNKLTNEPLEGCVVGLVDESNLFDWDVAIFGPPDTLYEGGYFKARLIFPNDYPYSPPQFRFTTKLWHPNVYESGELCISILHPPVDDPFSGELPSERWNPTQNVRTILLSVISLLNEPNTSSPANVDASVMFRRWRESLDKEYERIVRQQVLNSQHDAEKDGVQVPTTIQEYCLKTTRNSIQSKGNLGNCSYDDDDEDYFYNDDNDILDDDTSQESYEEDESQDEAEEITTNQSENISNNESETF